MPRRLSFLTARVRRRLLRIRVMDGCRFMENSWNIVLFYCFKDFLAVDGVCQLVIVHDFIKVLMWVCDVATMAARSSWSVGGRWMCEWLGSMAVVKMASCFFVRGKMKPRELMRVGSTISLSSRVFVSWAFLRRARVAMITSLVARDGASWEVVMLLNESTARTPSARGKIKARDDGRVGSRSSCVWSAFMVLVS